MPEMPTAPAPAVQRRRAGRDSSHPTFLEQRFFVVGVVWLLFTLASAGYIMFGPPLCSPLKITTFTTILSLAAGFFAWTFAGSIHARSRNLVPGVIIVATGGFAVFLVLQLKLDPDKMALDPECHHPRPRDSASQYFNEIAVHTSNVVKDLTEAKHNPALNRQVYEQALTLNAKIRPFPKEHLSELQRAVLALYGAQTAAALAIAMEPIAANARDARAFAKEAVAYAKVSNDTLASLMSRGDVAGQAAIDYVSTYKTQDKARYMEGLAKILEAQWAQLAGAKPEYSDADIAAAFSGLKSQFLRDISASTDGPIKWYCGSSKSKERAPCDAL